MKICFIADANSIHIHRWVIYFADKGHEVHVISNQSFGNDNIENMKNVKLHLFNKHISKIRCVSSLLKPFLSVILIRKLIRMIRPDILHVHYLSSSGIIGALTGARPFLISIWGSDILRDPKESKIIKYMLPFTLHRADIITTIPEFMNKYLVTTYGLKENKVVRIPWGIDLTIFFRGYEEEIPTLRRKLHIDVDSKVIVSNRSATPLYNIETIVKAAQNVLKVYPDTIFIFMYGYGSPEYWKKIKLKAENMGISENFRFVDDLLSSKEMAIYLNIANIMISIPKTDQFASSIMEGMACGTIPIVGNLKVYDQYLENNKNALFVDPEDSKEITQKIIHCIEHPELQEECYKINQKIIEKYENWDANADKMYKLYLDLLNKFTEN